MSDPPQRVRAHQIQISRLRKTRGTSRRTTIQTGESTVTADILAVSPSALHVLGVELSSGRLYDTFHTTHAPNVAILGEGAARRLGISHTDGTASITINSRPYTVIGIAATVTRRPAYTGMILIPLTDEPRSPAEANLEELLIETAPGAASVVASQAAVAISPHTPDQFTITAPPDASTFRQGIETTLRSTLLALGGVILIIGLLGIANATFVSVLERTNEIGIRRAIGARPLHISLQVLTESGITGGIGGLIGTSLAITTLVALSATNGWTPTLTATLLPLGPALGAITGCLAGIPPARRATRIQPTQALRL